MRRTYISTGRQRSRGAPLTLGFIAVAGFCAFLAGFALFYGMGERLAGPRQRATPPGAVARSPERAADATAGVSGRGYPVVPEVNLVGFRDLAYVPVKGIYVTSWIAGQPKKLDVLLGLAKRTEINAMVIDVKDDTGYVSYATTAPLARELGLTEPRIRDIDGLLRSLREQGIIPIARVVCFKDPLLARKRLEWAVVRRDGGLWKDRKGIAYVSPYRREIWEYLVDVAEDAAGRGFREIQFDYVRFPSDGDISLARYPGKDRAPEDAVAAFLAYARERLEGRGVWLSADVFGLTLHAEDDLGIGQKIEKIARNVDIVCPMVYPSHYYAGSYNLENPNGSPYETVTFAMKDATRRLDGTGALVRPWLQDFSLGIRYGVAEVKAQIRAAEEQGYTEWILWNPGNTYTEGALRPD